MKELVFKKVLSSGGFYTMKLFSLFLACLGTITCGFLSATAPGSLWKEYRYNPIYNPIGITNEDYYPCVLFDKDCFNGHGEEAHYKMWHQGLNGIALSISKDGTFWLLRAPTVVSGDAFHPCVVYDKEGFEEGVYHYKMWFWNGVASRTIDAIQYCYSVDGVNWTKPKPIQQDSDHPLVDGVRGSFFYHLRGPGFVFYQKNAHCLPLRPYTYPYVMLFDTASEGLATEGGFQQIALAYSLDGVEWKRYTNGPIFIPSGKATDWDGTYAFRPSLVYVNGAFHMYYSGSNGSPTSGYFHADGIGHATSADGIYWVKDPSNPIISALTGPKWRNNRTYTPFVIYNTFTHSNDPDDRYFKMWYTGGTGDFVGQNQAIGFATSPAPSKLTNPNNIPEPPRDFEAKVKKQTTTPTTYTLTATWKPSSSKHVIAYRIYKSGRVVDTIPVKKNLQFVSRIESKSSWQKYSISAVNDLGLESCRVNLKKDD